MFNIKHKKACGLPVRGYSRGRLNQTMYLVCTYGSSRCKRACHVFSVACSPTSSGKQLHGQFQLQVATGKAMARKKRVIDYRELR